VLDDRFNTFKVQGSALAAHFDTDTLCGRRSGWTAMR
jgi:hypothetical protein